MSSEFRFEPRSFDTQFQSYSTSDEWADAQQPVTPKRTPIFPESVRKAFQPKWWRWAALALALAGMAVLFMLASFSPLDNSWNSVGVGSYNNAFGGIGALISDLLLQAFGYAAFLVPAFLWVLAWQMLTLRRLPRLIARLGMLCLGLVLLATALNISAVPSHWGRPLSWGGGMGSLVQYNFHTWLLFPNWLTSLLAFAPSLLLLGSAVGISAEDWSSMAQGIANRLVPLGQETGERAHKSLQSALNGGRAVRAAVGAAVASGGGAGKLTAKPQSAAAGGGAKISAKAERTGPNHAKAPQFQAQFQAHPQAANGNGYHHPRPAAEGWQQPRSHHVHGDDYHDPRAYAGDHVAQNHTPDQASYYGQTPYHDNYQTPYHADAAYARRNTAMSSPLSQPMPAARQAAPQEPSERAKAASPFYSAGGGARFGTPPMAQRTEAPANHAETRPARPAQPQQPVHAQQQAARGPYESDDAYAAFQPIVGARLADVQDKIRARQQTKAPAASYAPQQASYDDVVIETESYETYEAPMPRAEEVAFVSQNAQYQAAWQDDTPSVVPWDTQEDEYHAEPADADYADVAAYQSNGDQSFDHARPEQQADWQREAAFAQQEAASQVARYAGNLDQHDEARGRYAEQDYAPDNDMPVDDGQDYQDWDQDAETAMARADEASQVAEDEIVDDQIMHDPSADFGYGAYTFARDNQVPEEPEAFDDDEDDFDDFVPQAQDDQAVVSRQSYEPEPMAKQRKVTPVSSAQLSVQSFKGIYQHPSTEFLAPADPGQLENRLTREEAHENARALEAVLSDFNVRGTIVSVKPGPVVTLYELEPAPGTKTSRVVGLADDIARSMAALSARIAVVPGRNVIGIELPNPRRETVYFRDMLESKSYTDSALKLPMALGKDISGEPITVDLAKMPHLLIAGTTGSGKSVAVNTMILSLLYKLSPEQCKFIMIDPKMLELSVYDGIPHLLCPTVIDPKKAVVALNWAVKEMEDRYRAMSQVGVRNIDGFNARLRQAKANGEVILRKVQTGFNPETGEAVFEEQEMDLTPLPYIVIIVDELADLMLVAGKDIEAALQRLAQMARAAGLHLVMATQRPSVDVITGTIKANFPTRISFHVTSKIDSRTILGEMGAEQLLGMGDMLYMPSGGRIKRVHGPFATDGEVEKVVNFLKAQGNPSYIGSITEDPEEAAAQGEMIDDTALSSGFGQSGDDMYDQAVGIVLKHKKASTSFVQRQLQIGYNRAARLIERMEEEGLISASDHVGRRQILAGGDSSEG